MRIVTSWTLGDAEQRHHDSPRNFSIPRAAARAALQPGQLVKLQFLFDRPADDGCEAERMWVKIVEAGGGRYVGALDNEPARIAVLKLGDRIEFEPRHVTAIYVPQGDPGWIDPQQVAVVGVPVLEGLWPARVVRQAPIVPRDSGWRILAADDGDAAARGPGALRACTTYGLMAIHPVLDSVLGSPELAAWRWDEAALEYRPDDGAAPPALGPAPAAALTRLPLPYDDGEGAFTSLRVLEGAWPAYLVRSDREHRGESGWQILAGDEGGEYLDDADNIRYVPLSALLQRHPILDLVLGRTEPGGWEWDATAGDYVKAPG